MRRPSSRNSARQVIAGLPLAVHALLLAVLLATAAAWVGAAGTVSVDEGVAVIQADELADGRWAIEYPLADIDPNGSAFPLWVAEPAEGGWVPYAKHPLYPTVLSGLVRVGGIRAVIAASIGGTVVASLCAALLAKRLRPVLAVPCLYVTGVVSPLFFDGFVVLAHSMAAALAGIAAVALVRHHDVPRRWVSWWLLLAAPGLLGVAMLRGEGILLLAALGVVSAVGAAASRRPAWCGTAALAGGIAAVSVLVERAWRSDILGVRPAGISGPGAGSSGSWMYDRLQGLLSTTLKTGYDGAGGDLAIFGCVALLVVATIAFRRGGSDERAGAAMSVGAAVLAVVWLVVAPPSPVPGILVAFPALWVGLSVGRWYETKLAQVLVAVAAVFWVLVAGSQYPQGGGLEWGARYLAIALPMVVPVALLGLLTCWERVTSRRLAALSGGSLLLVSAVLSAMALLSQQVTNDGVRRFEDRMAEVVAASTLGPGDTDRRPIVVSADFVIPQVTWSLYDDYRWLRIRDGQPLEELEPDARVQALLEAGVDRFTLVTRDLRVGAALLGPHVEIGPDRGRDGWSIVEVTPTG